MDPETDLLVSRILMWVGILGVAVTLVLEYLGVFQDWDIILSILFGLVGVLGVMKGATRDGVNELLRRLAGIGRNQAQTNDRLDQTNATLQRMAATLERIEGRLSPPSGL